MKTTLFLVGILSASFLFAGEHQNFLKKKRLLYPGWQDEGTLEVRAELPKYSRKSTADLHKLVLEMIALEERCKDRKPASDQEVDEDCPALEQ